MTDTIATRLDRVRTTIGQLESQYDRPEGAVTLLAVSKTKPVADIRAAMAIGQRCFGENYVDEAISKIREIGHAAEDGTALSWHFIGAIQSRKTTDIATHFDWAHGVDRLKVAERLSRARTEAGLEALNICLQVALDDEPGKAGAPPEELQALAEHAACLPGLRLRGLMAIPAPRTGLAGQREVFRQLSVHFTRLADRFDTVDTLSCGMSGDLEAAIAEGATLVRIGTAIFGARHPPR